MTDPRTFEIIGAAMEVHRELGSGFLEAVYQEALAKEFSARQVPFNPQPQLTIYFKGTALEKHYSPDFICFGEIIVEIKALSALSSTEESQVINYLKASQLHIGLLINFGARSLDYRRFILSGR